MNLTTGEKKFTDKAYRYAGFHGDNGEPRVNIEGVVEIAGASDIDISSSTINSDCYIGKSSSAVGGDFVVTYTAATQLTFSSYPAGISSLTATDIEMIRQIASTGAVTATYHRDDATMTMSGAVITVTGATFTNTDTFIVFTNVPRAASSSAAGAGGGNNTYSNASGDFTATITDSTTNITIAGLPFTLEAKHVAAGWIKKIAVTSNDVTYVPTTNVSVSGGVITLADADNFATGDVVVVMLVGPDKAYDVSLDNQLVAVQNPEYAHTTSIETISETNLGTDGTATGTDADTLTDSGAAWAVTSGGVAVGYEAYDVTEAAAATVLSVTDGTNIETDAVTDWSGDTYSLPQLKRFEISADTYKYISIHYRLHAADEHNSAYMKLYVTNDSDADTDSDDYWIDITNDVFSVAQIEADGIGDVAEATEEGIGFITSPQIVLKYMIKIVAECDNGTQDNDFDIYIKKG